jgi:SOS response associated peptidase (SRAP)
MCGRFTYRLTWPELVRLYRLTLDAPARNTQPRYNICPTTNIDAVIERDGKRELSTMRWGLIPSWWSKPLKEMKVATFNARAESVDRDDAFCTRGANAAEGGAGCAAHARGRAGSRSAADGLGSGGWLVRFPHQRRPVVIERWLN